jgi:hypothetical protein
MKCNFSEKKRRERCRSIPLVVHAPDRPASRARRLGTATAGAANYTVAGRDRALPRASGALGCTRRRAGPDFGWSEAARVLAMPNVYSRRLRLERRALSKSGRLSSRTSTWSIWGEDPKPLPQVRPGQHQAGGRARAPMPSDCAVTYAGERNSQRNSQRNSRGNPEAADARPVEGRCAASQGIGPRIRRAIGSVIASSCV